LPRGASGKLARSELAALVAATIGQGNEPPIGRDETEIARIFADVLKATSVGRRDNFFDLGGDSLSAMNALTAVAAALGVSVRLEVLFDCPTVSELATAIGERKRSSGANPAPTNLGKIERRR
jgi:acyl carrier protein